MKIIINMQDGIVQDVVTDAPPDTFDDIVVVDWDTDGDDTDLVRINDQDGYPMTANVQDVIVCQYNGKRDVERIYEAWRKREDAENA